MKKLILASIALFVSMTVQAADQAVIDRYNKTCVVCHAAGAAGAPKTGDVAAWKPRMEKGMDVMVASATNGMGAMPPKAMCFDCTPDDYKALIEYMATAK
jgi:cytochrome c5